MPRWKAHAAVPAMGDFWAHVEERVSGVMFIVVPLSGESARWFRFARLKP